MKVRLVTKAYHTAINQIRATHPHGISSPDALKRAVSIEAIISFSLEQEAEFIGGEARWLCPFHADTNPSLWARDDHRGTGMGKWGCNAGCCSSDDVFGFLRRLHGYTMAEAFRWVKVWQLNHRGVIKVRLRRSGR